MEKTNNISKDKLLKHQKKSKSNHDGKQHLKNKETNFEKMYTKKEEEYLKMKAKLKEVKLNFHKVNNKLLKEREKFNDMKRKLKEVALDAIPLEDNSKNLLKHFKHAKKEHKMLLKKLTIKETELCELRKKECKDRKAKEKLVQQLSEVKTMVGNLVIRKKSMETQIKNIEKTIINNREIYAKAKQDFTNNLIEMIDSELRCTICNDTFVDTTTLNCKHSFCAYCINQWNANKTDCPLCRTKITSLNQTMAVDNFIDKIIETFPKDLQTKRKERVQELRTLAANIVQARESRSSRRNRSDNDTFPVASLRFNVAVNTYNDDNNDNNNDDNEYGNDEEDDFGISIDDDALRETWSDDTESISGDEDNEVNDDNRPNFVRVINGDLTQDTIEGIINSLSQQGGILVRSRRLHRNESLDNTFFNELENNSCVIS